MLTLGLACQRFHQQLCVVGNDSVHAHSGGAQHFARIIDGPGNHHFAGGMQLIHQLLSKQSVVGHHVTDRQRLPPAQMPIRFRDRTQDQGTIESMQLADDAGQK